jgi:hypothetical protein
MDDPFHSVRATLLAGRPDPSQVELRPDNEDVGTLFMLTRHQVVTAGQGQPIDISLPAIQVAMECLGTVDRRDSLLRVRNLWHEIAQRRAPEA